MDVRQLGFGGEGMDASSSPQPAVRGFFKLRRLLRARRPIERPTRVPILKEDSMPKFQGKVAVVTGGSSGIGLATAKRFVEEGAFVYITGRRQTELDKAVSLIGHSVTAVQADVSNLAALDRLYAKVASEMGQIDILFAGAGIVDPQPLAETTEESFDKDFAISTHGSPL